MGSVIFQRDGTCMEPPSVSRAALMTGHLISISPESGSIPQRISRHICSVSTLHKPVESWSCGACGPAWQQKTVVAVGACPIVMEVKFWPRAFQGLEARLVLFFIISCVVSIRKKKIYEVWMQKSQVWNSSHIWKVRLTQGNNATVFVTHILWDLTTENNLHFIQALFTWGW